MPLTVTLVDKCMSTKCVQYSRNRSEIAMGQGQILWVSRCHWQECRDSTLDFGSNAPTRVAVEPAEGCSTDTNFSKFQVSSVTWNGQCDQTLLLHQEMLHERSNVCPVQHVNSLKQTTVTTPKTVPSGCQIVHLVRCHGLNRKQPAGLPQCFRTSEGQRSSYW